MSINITGYIIQKMHYKGISYGQFTRDKNNVNGI